MGDWGYCPSPKRSCLPSKENFYLGTVEEVYFLPLRLLIFPPQIIMRYLQPCQSYCCLKIRIMLLALVPQNWRTALISTLPFSLSVCLCMNTYYTVLLLIPRVGTRNIFECQRERFFHRHRARSYSLTHLYEQCRANRIIWHAQIRIECGNMA